MLRTIEAFGRAMPALAASSLEPSSQGIGNHS